MAEVLTYICPYCDSEVQVGRPCAKCERKAKKSKRRKKSWEQDPSADGLDLPDDDFEYNEFVAKEFGASPHRQTGLKWYWWALAIAIFVAMLTGAFMIG